VVSALGGESAHFGRAGNAGDDYCVEYSQERAVKAGGLTTATRRIGRVE
jgi:hypothetical protein